MQTSKKRSFFPCSILVEQITITRFEQTAPCPNSKEVILETITVQFINELFPTFFIHAHPHILTNHILCEASLLSISHLPTVLVFTRERKQTTRDQH